MHRFVMENRGVTLVELLVVVSIIGILAAAVGFTYQGWQGRYNVESEMRQIQADLMKARADAIGKQRDFFVHFTCDSTTKECTDYSVYEDTNPWPDGNTTLESSGTSHDTLVKGYPKTIAYPVTWHWNSGGALDVVHTIIFDGRGIINLDNSGTVVPADGSVVVASSTAAATSENSDNDCVMITQIKMSAGRWDVADAECDVR